MNDWNKPAELTVRQLIRIVNQREYLEWGPGNRFSLRKGDIIDNWAENEFGEGEFCRNTSLIELANCGLRLTVREAALQQRILDMVPIKHREAELIDSLLAYGEDMNDEEGNEEISNCLAQGTTGRHAPAYAAAAVYISDALRDEQIVLRALKAASLAGKDLRTLVPNVELLCRFMAEMI